MTKEEFGKLVMAIKGYFPKQDTFNSPYVMEMWFDSLKDLDFSLAINSIKGYAQTNKFPPTVADIRSTATAFAQDEVMSELEAWALVSKAIRNGTYGSETEFNKLPPLVQKAVGSPANIRNWATSSLEEVETVISSNFIKTYRALMTREKTINRMSPDLQISMRKERETIDGCNEQKRISG